MPCGRLRTKGNLKWPKNADVLNGRPLSYLVWFLYAISVSLFMLHARSLVTGCCLVVLVVSRVMTEIIIAGQFTVQISVLSNDASPQVILNNARLA